MKIVFVCLGNICRSPLAEGIAKHLYKKTYTKKEIEFTSAGTSGFHNGDSIDSRSIDIAKKHNIDISSYTSKQVSVYKHSDVDLFLAMDKQNIANLVAMGFDRDKIKLLGEYGLGSAEIGDPYYGGVDGFERVYDSLEKAIQTLLKELK